MVSIHPSIYPNTHHPQGSYLLIDVKRAGMNETSILSSGDADRTETPGSLRENNYRRSLTNGATPLWGKFLKYFHVPTV